MKYRKHLLVSSALIGCVAAMPAIAQQTAQLEEITVTARKQEESLLQVPLAVTAITAEQIEAKNMITIDDVSLFTPGFTNQNLSVNRNDRGFRVYILRGILPGNGLATRQAASIFVDGALVFGGNISNLTDVDHVETVKGPQSAYFGRGTFSGAINFVTRPPDMEKWGGRASADYASWATTNMSASLEGPIVADKLAVRIAGTHYRTGGAWSDVGFPGSRLGSRSTRSVTGSFIFKPNDNLKVRGYATYFRDSDGPSAIAEFVGPNAQQGKNSYNCNAGLGVGGAFNYICGELKTAPNETQFWNTYIDPNYFRALVAGSAAVPFSTPVNGAKFIDHMGLERSAYELHGSVEYEATSGYSVMANGSYDTNKWGFLQAGSFIDTRGVPNPFYPPAATAYPSQILPYTYSLVLGNTGDTDQNAELRLTSPSNQKLTGSIGVNYFHALSYNMTPSVGTTGYLLGTPLSHFENTTYGIFGSLTYHFTDQLSLSGEARQQWETIFQDTLAGTNPTFSNKSTAFTPRVILQYQPDQNTTYYASYAEGTRPIEINSNFYALTPSQQAQILTQVPVGGIVPADRIKMGEVGAKGLFFDNTLRIMADIYYGHWTGRHVPNTVTYTLATGLPGTTQVTSAGGIVDLKGLELEATYRANENLTFDATFDYADTDLKATFCTDCLVTTGNPRPVGTSFPYVPKVTWTLSSTYTRPVFGDYNGYFRVDYLHRGKIYESEANLAWLAPTNKFNVAFGVEDGKYRLELYGKNIFDDRTPVSLQRNAYTNYSPTGTTVNTPNAISVALPDKATWGVRGSVKF